MKDSLDAATSPDAAASAAAGEPTAALVPASPAEITAPTRVVALASGRSLEVAEEGGAERIRVRSAEGQILVSIRMTAEGPVLSLKGASLEIAAAKTLSLSCDTLRVQAAQDASIEVGGSLREDVRGSVVREAGRSARISAREVKVEASQGGVEIQANDDVAITGERVRLNSDDPPMPLSWEEHRARRTLAGGPGLLAAPGAEDGGDLGELPAAKPDP